LFFSRKRPEVLLMQTGEPLAFDLDYIEKFIKDHLTISGESLRNRLDRCVRIVTLTHPKTNELIGLAAIKQPFKTYREKILKGWSLPEFKYELGYVALVPSYRGLGLSSSLIQEALYRFDYNVFSTVDTSNKAMAKTLRQNGFEFSLNFYAELDPKKLMSLFILKEKVVEVEKQIFSGWFPVSYTDTTINVSS
jgi:GNAT superfamily N-acetyltransferase